MDLFYTMNPFDEIIYKTFFPFTPESMDNAELGVSRKGLNHFFSYKKASFYSIFYKWKSFNDIINNIFIGDEIREELIDLICKIQRTIHGLYRFKHLWRLHKAKCHNADDLYMNPISPTDKGAIVIFENNTKYIFQLRELIHVIQSSLSNCCHFFPDPIQAKNPYTNLPFHKSNLYNIYFAVRSSNYRMPLLFEEFFRHNFNLNKFLSKNEEWINDEYLKSYVENNCLENVFEHVQDMLKEHHIRSHIHSDFPKDRLFMIMKPYLSLYFISNYSMNDYKKTRAFRMLHRKLHLFQNYNRCFGRRKVQFVSKNPFSPIKKCVYVFDEKHIPFQRKEFDNFLTSHLDSPDVQQNHHHHSSTEETNNPQDEEEEDEEEEEDDESVTDDEDEEPNAIFLVNERFVHHDDEDDDGDDGHDGNEHDDDEGDDSVD